MRNFSQTVVGYTFWRHLGKFQKIINLGTSRSTFWPGDVLGSCFGPEKSTFARKPFSGEDAREIPAPKQFLWSLGRIWWCYFVKNRCVSMFSSQFHIFPENWGTPQGRFV